jgi:uncharacterized membrane protein YphA (DoxX/SURF4 family)
MQSKTATWVGWILTLVPALLLLSSAAMKLFGVPGLSAGFEHLGWPMHLAVTLGILELAVTLACLIPRIAVLGAILVTGYMGGAIATHIRVGDPFFTQVLIGMAIWGGLYLREPRLRTLLPLTK